MAEPHDALVELSRLALAGDTTGARNYLHLLLRRSPSPGGEDAAMREALARLLLSSTATTAATTAAARAARRTAPPSSPHAAATAFRELDAAREQGGAMPAVVAEHANDGPLTRAEIPARAPAPTLSRRVRSAVDSILLERRSAAQLRAAGVEPTRSVLLVGPPGVGKTMTARFLAAAAGLPLVTLDLAAVMSSLLGQSAQNLRRALELGSRSPCVFLIDEIDALAKRRNDPSDVGELKRLVNVLLLELERWPADSLLVAATNHPELLDRALWRRFDRVLAIPRPGFRGRRRILADAVASYHAEIDPTELSWCAAATPGQTGADLQRLVRDAIRASVLGGEPARVGEEMVSRAMDRLEGEGRRYERARGAFCRLATRHLGLSQREVARRLGISHVQVGRLLKDDRRDDTRPHATSSTRPPGRALARGRRRASSERDMTRSLAPVAERQGPDERGLAYG